MSFCIDFWNRAILVCRRNVIFSAIMLGVVLSYSFPSGAAELQRGLVRNTTSQKSTAIDDTIVKGHFRALVIGNNDYQDKEHVWIPLRTAVNGANAVANVLKNDYGFDDVRIVRNAKYREIVKALSDLVDATETNDNVLIYYAGHGYRNEKTSEAYWIPVDAEGWDDSLFVSNGRIKEKLAALSGVANHVMLISDSCFSGTLIRGGNRGAMKSERSRQYFQKVANRKSVQIISAGGAEYVDDDYRNSGQSPFTYFLLQELNQNDEPFISATELATEIEIKVANNVQQTPQKGVLYGAGDEGGEFVFVKVSVAQASGDTTTVEIRVPNASKHEPVVEITREHEKATNADTPLMFAPFVSM